MFSVCFISSLHGVDMVRVLDMNCCSICKEDFEGYGNNAQPVNDGVCCNDCNMMYVIKRRIFDMQMNKGEE